jgi:hypothetical protein
MEVPPGNWGEMYLTTCSSSNVRNSSISHSNGGDARINIVFGV